MFSGSASCTNNQIGLWCADVYVVVICHILLVFTRYLLIRVTMFLKKANRVFNISWADIRQIYNP